MNRVSRWGALLLVVVATLLAGPGARADTSTLTPTLTPALTPTAEAWYQPNPTCSSPLGCLTTTTLPVAPPVAVPMSPYPARTLQVGYSGGEETARSYLALPLDNVSGTITAAHLLLPIDTATADGSRDPDTAHAQVCLFSGTIAEVDGSIDEPPATSCASGAPLVYVPTPSPHFTADLTGLLVGLASSDGLAIVPDLTTVTETDAWQIAFSAHDRTDAAKTPPAVITLSVAAEQQATGPGPTQAAVPPGLPFTTVTQPQAPTFVPGRSAPAVPAPAPTVVGAAPSAPPAAVVQRAASIFSVGFAYPVVLLLPLVLLVLVPLVGQSLTRDVTPLKR